MKALSLHVAAVVLLLVAAAPAVWAQGTPPPLPGPPITSGTEPGDFDYPGNGRTGFGGPVGMGGLDIEDDGVTVTLTVTRGSAGLFDDLVLYFDVGPGGFVDTADFTDTADRNRRAISGFNGAHRATIIFPTAFRPEYAIAVNTGFGGLWQLQANGSHDFIAAVGGPDDANVESFTMSFDKAALGIPLQEPVAFRFYGTYLNGNDAFRSNEGYTTDYPADNIGQASFTATTFLVYESDVEPPPPSGIFTVAPGNWGSPATWNIGEVPEAGASVTLNHAVVLDVPATVNVLTIASAGSLDGGTQTLTVASGGSIVNDGAFTAGGGTVAFAGNGSVNGSVVTRFNAVTIAGGVGFGTAEVQGSLTLLAGGFVAATPPTYLAGSTLRYATGGAYGVGSEWAAGGTASGPGYPFDVEVATSTLTLGTSARLARGTVRVLAGGSLALSATEGADLTIGGSLVVDGTFAPGERLVTFSSDAAQSIGGSVAGLTLPFLGKAGAGTLTVGLPVRLEGRLFLSGGTLASGVGRVTFGSRVSTNGNGETLVRVGVIDNDGGALAGSHRYERRYTLVQSGWRFLSAPAADVPFTSLNDGFQTQGFPGAVVPGGDPNLFFFDGTAFVPVPGGSFTPGAGYLFYMTTEAPAPGLPATWRMEGLANTSASLAPNVDPAFLFAGNPFLGHLVWADVLADADDVTPNYWIWDPAGNPGGGSGNYRVFNAATEVGDAGPVIAPYQGFFVEASGPAPSLSFQPAQVDNDRSPLFVGRPASADPAPHVRLDLSGQGLAARAWAVRWDGGTDGADPGDAPLLGSLDAAAAALWFADDERLLMMDARPLALTPVSYALGVAATQAGTYTLAWPTLAESLPPTWQVRLTDLATGATIDPRAVPSYTFTLTEAALRPGGLEAATAMPFAGGRSPETRFALLVDPLGVSAEGDAHAATFALDALYPNPTAAAATVAFSLASAGDASVHVYDLMGRRVATLAEGTFGAGRHTATLDASGLASGSYVVRLVAGGQVATERLTVVR